MPTNPLAQLLTDDHQAIDEVIDAFLADPSGVARATAPMRAAITGLRRHIYLEEEIIFPALPDARLAAPVMVMEREHAQIWQTLAALEREIEARSGGGVPATEHAKALRAVLEQHNFKEERVVYAAFEAIPEQTARRIGALVAATAAAPDGWVCRLARG
ncbi:MAG: hemerythrin domain-containing protein [Actinomycetia bacterium]|nr:hemerythrin domain-containing protein [Actinomycetes bacterium]